MAPLRLLHERPHRLGRSCLHPRPSHSRLGRPRPHFPLLPRPPPSIPFRRLLDLLAFEEAIKPKVARVALLHWLATWAAQQTGSRLACPPLSCVFNPASPHVGVPAPCPLSAQRWYTELNHRKDDGSIRTPNISTAITAAARRANPQAEDPPAGPGAPAPAAAPAPPNASQPLS